MKLQTLDELKDRFYGLKGSEKRDQLDRELDVLRIGILIRNARKESKLTQAELAERIGKKRAFISRVENDGSNLTIATLLDIVEKGLGKKRTSSTISARSSLSIFSNPLTPSNHAPRPRRRPTSLRTDHPRQLQFEHLCYNRPLGVAATPLSTS